MAQAVDSESDWVHRWIVKALPISKDMSEDKIDREGEIEISRRYDFYLHLPVHDDLFGASFDNKSSHAKVKSDFNR